MCVTVSACLIYEQKYGISKNVRFLLGHPVYFCVLLYLTVNKVVLYYITLHSQTCFKAVHKFVFYEHLLR